MYVHRVSQVLLSNLISFSPVHISRKKHGNMAKLKQLVAMIYQDIFVKDVFAKTEMQG